MTDKREALSECINLRVKPSELLAWRRAAEQDERTLSGWVRRQINLAAKRDA